LFCYLLVICHVVLFLLFFLDFFFRLGVSEILSFGVCYEPYHPNPFFFFPTIMFASDPHIANNVSFKFGGKECSFVLFLFCLYVFLLFIYIY
jgi:hypothetical protein